MKQDIALQNTNSFNINAVSVFNKLTASLVKVMRRRQTIKQLNNLPDNLLNDIGFERYELAQAVKTPASYAKLVARRTEQAGEMTRLKIAA